MLLTTNLKLLLRAGAASVIIDKPTQVAATPVLDLKPDVLDWLSLPQTTAVAQMSSRPRDVNDEDSISELPKTVSS